MVRLDSTTVHSSPGVDVGDFRRVLVRLDSSSHPLESVDFLSQPSQSWWADSLTDSIRLAFFDGLNGSIVILAAPNASADSLSGRIEERWHVGPTIEDRGSVKAVRRLCQGAA